MPKSPLHHLFTVTAVFPMNRIAIRTFCIAWFAVPMLASPHWVESASAVNPEVLRRGADLFQNEFSSQHPMLGGDGLGPLFNARSCVACHHQGGVGGSGDARFNAKALEIESLEVSQPTNLAVVATTLRQIHPAFAPPGSPPIATVNLPHFGGSPVMDRLRASSRSGIDAHPDRSGGEASAVEVRRRSDHRWTVTLPLAGVRGQTMKVEMVVHQRNTTPLFGSAEIDAIDPKQIERLEKIQKRHAEISGRISLLEDGMIGRFGWRGNQAHLADFVRQACANEMGLQSKDTPQPMDPGMTASVSGHTDISDSDIASLTSFVATLPAPRPTPSLDNANAGQGSAMFERIGCAVCHVQHVGPAKDVYSDFLLHDMGPNLYDYATAKPDVKSVQITFREGVIASTPAGYYGESQPMLPSGQSFTRVTIQSRIQTPKHHSGGNDFLVIDKSIPVSRTQFMGSNSRRLLIQKQKGLARTLNPSMVAQEWRTPPLWGVADSAPYMHDGRAETLLEAIMMHGGESEATRNRFLNLSLEDREAILAFLKTLKAPPIADHI